MHPGASLTLRAVAFALVAAAAFAAGLTVGGAEQTPASVAARLSLVGDRLNSTPNETADFTDFWKAWNALEENFVITNASSTLPTIEERMWGAISGLAASYGDPYTVYFPPEDAKEFHETISGTFAGVGMEIDVKDGVLTVIAPLKGTPAEAAGILAGDKITAIDGEETGGISTEQAVRKIRGPAGTNVVLTILRDGKELILTVTRAIIQIPETDDSYDEKTGVYRIALYAFTANSHQHFNQAFARFKKSGAKLLVLDLRGNPGGYLNSSIRIASHFLPKGTPVVTEDFGGKEENKVHTSIGYNDLPRGTKTVILIDGGSASASEILASALKDAGRATLVGTKTFGKGSVQQLIDLGKGSIKVTTARWVTPAGRWITNGGVEPDIVVERTRADAEAGKDPQMERAVRFLTTGE